MTKIEKQIEYKRYLALVNFTFLRVAARQCGLIVAVDLSITNFCGMFGLTTLYSGTLILIKEM